jgi:hypothetical protein
VDVAEARRLGAFSTLILLLDLTFRSFPPGIGDRIFGREQNAIFKAILYALAPTQPRGAEQWDEPGRIDPRRRAGDRCCYRVTLATFDTPNQL